MRRDAPLIAAALTQLFVLLAAAAFHWRVRPGLLQAYQRAAQPLPPSAALALSAWLLPTALAIAAAAASWALLSRGKRSARLRLLAIGLTVSGVAFVFAALASMVPMLG